MDGLTRDTERPAPPPGPYLVAGAGRAGVAAAGALARHVGAGQVHVWDGADDDVTRSARDRLAARGIACTLGGDGTTLLAGRARPACLVKSPGIPFRAPLIASAQAAGLPVIDEFDLGWRLDDRPTVAITGTNGKSTVAEMLRSILAAAGHRPVIAGNTLFGEPLSAVPAAMADLIIAETSGLQIEGAPAFRPDAAAYTNLTLDHLGNHPSLEHYAATKRRLFVREDWAVPVAAIGIDQRFGADLADELEARGTTVLRAGPGGDYALRTAATGWDGTTLTATTPRGEETWTIASHGAHMARNAIVTLALADGLGVARSISIPELATARPVPGRFERIPADLPFAVVVDFAHNADGVTQALATARRLGAPGARVIVVAAATSVHDPAQQEGIGRAAGHLADHLVLTTDRRFTSDPLGPPEPFLRGAAATATGTPVIEHDRATAFFLAVAAARAGDVVMLLGRGARQIRVAGEDDAAVDDRDLARAAIAAQTAG